MIISKDKLSSKWISASCSAMKVDSKGKQLVARKLATDKNGGLNIHGYHLASLVWNVADDALGLVIARTMLPSGDGLNHQAGVLVTLDAKDLSTMQDRGTTASHDFGNSVHLSEDGKFLGTIIGDAYPRGIKLFDFSRYSKQRGIDVYKIKINKSYKFGYNQVRLKAEKIYMRACFSRRMH